MTETHTHARARVCEHEITNITAEHGREAFFGLKPFRSDENSNFEELGETIHYEFLQISLEGG